MAVLRFKGSNGIIQTIKQIIINSTIDEERIKEEILLAAHPIGSLYWSRENTDPGLLFGGNWVRVKDKFILAAGDSYTTGNTGGSATKTIAKANLPNYTLYNANHSHSFSAGWTMAWGNNAQTVARSQDDAVGGPTTSNQFYISSNTITSTNITVNSGGSGTALNIMPPYEVFYCWVRVANTDKTESECREIANTFIHNHINSQLSVNTSTMSYDSTYKTYTWNISNTSYTISVNAVNGGWSHNMPNTVRGNYLIQDYTGNDPDYSFTFSEIMPAGSTSMMGTDISGWYGYEYYNQGSLNGYYYIDISYSEDIEFDK